MSDLQGAYTLSFMITSFLLKHRRATFMLPDQPLDLTLQLAYLGMSFLLKHRRSTFVLPN